MQSSVLFPWLQEAFQRPATHFLSNSAERFCVFDFTLCAPNPRRRQEKVGRSGEARNKVLCPALWLLAAPQNANAYSPDLPSSVRNWRNRSRSEPRCGNWHHKASAAALALTYSSPDSQTESGRDFLSRKLPASALLCRGDVLKSGLGKRPSEHFPAWASPCGAIKGMGGSSTGIWLPLRCAK